MPAWLWTALDVTILVFMLVSQLGLVMPVFPGLVVIWGLALVHALATGFQIGWGWLALLTVLMVIGSLADNVLMGAKARQDGASWVSIGMALLGGLVASFFLTPLVGLLAAPLTLYLAEYARRRDAAAAWKVTKALMIGWGWAFVVRFGLGLMMIGLWAWRTF